MSSNVKYVVCPECGALNAARFNLLGSREYDVTCSVCGYEFEHGYYGSVRNLTLEEFLRDHQQSAKWEQDIQDYEVSGLDISDNAHMEMLKRIYGEYWE